MPTIDPSRRALFRGQLRPPRASHRVPWMVDDFMDVCQRCDDCIRACEPGVLRRADGGFPSIDFQRGGCEFCAACVAACEHGALDSSDDRPAWRLTARIGEGCLDARGITCRTCGDACETRAIRFQLAVGGRALPTLDPSLCNGCGSCIALCPVHIIEIEEPA